MDTLGSRNLAIPVVFMVSGPVGPLAKHVADAVLADVWPGNLKRRDQGGGLKQALQAAFTQGRPIIAIGASGAVIRLLAPLIVDKKTDPPVLVVSPDGTHVVPVLGGHAGGNDLAHQIAEKLDITAVISTASDAVFGVNLEVPPPGWVLSQHCDYKEVISGLLKREEITVSPEIDWIPTDALPTGSGANSSVKRRIWSSLVSVRPLETLGHLVYHPKRLVVGVGCERNTPESEVIAAVRQVLEDHRLAPEAVAAVVSIDLKSDEPAVHAVAADLDVPARFFDVDQLKTQEPRLVTPSDVVKAEVGVAGVAEAAALMAVGVTGHLHVPKKRFQRVTVAIGLSPTPMLGAQLGRPQGCLRIVGLGPGHAIERTPLADAYLRHAQHVVGFTAYFDYVTGWRDDQVLHKFDLGQEQDRVRHALGLAAAGHDVALIGSGDAGIYAMGALVFEEIEKAADPRWARIDVTSAPGITALQAASARVGAMLGHDFCAISLSDLLTPWSVIERRIAGAAIGDFVIAFYNPVSKRRRTALAKARDMLLEDRPADTPVLIGRELGRPDEELTLSTLADLSVDDVDMLSVVVVGSSETRRLARASGLDWVYTPRGYANKEPQ